MGRFKDGITKATVPTLRASYISTSIRDLDPARIHWHPQYELLVNLYSTLVEYDPEGALVSGIAKRFYWKGNELHLEIRDDVVTVGGHRIDVQDAAVSLKRLMVLQSNSHGNLSSFLCPGRRLQNIDEPCSGVQVEGTTLILSPVVGKDLLLPMLTSMDFAIIPGSALDDSKLKIVNLTETSGPYHVLSRSKDGLLTLEANTRHWHIGPKTPRMVEIHEVIHEDGSMPEVSFDTYERGGVDYIASNASPNTSRYQSLAAKRPDSQLRTTFDLRREVLFFTDRGRRELTREERFDTSLILLEALHERHNPSLTGGSISTQFLSPLTEGALKPDQLEAIEIFRRRADYKRLNVRPKIAVLEDDVAFFRSLLGSNADRLELQVVESWADLVDGKLVGNREPHCYLTATDIAWNESVTFLSYALAKNQFAISGAAAQQWFTTYISETDHARRVAMVNQLHFEALSDPKLVPLYSEPYHSILRHPWSEPRSAISPAQGLWRIEWNG